MDKFDLNELVRLVEDVEGNDNIHSELVRAAVNKSIEIHCLLKQQEEHKDNANAAGCPTSFDSVLCWPRTPPGMLAVLPCFEEFKGVQYDSTQNATRLCFLNGTWANYTSYDKCHHAPPSPIPDFSPGIELPTLIYCSGYFLSLAALTLALIVFLYFKDLKCLRNTIHANLFLTYILSALLWILTLFLQVMTDHPSQPGCISLVVLFHYFNLTNFFWMFVEGLYLYTLVVQTFSSENIYFALYAFIGWGCPAIIVFAWSIAKIYSPPLETERFNGADRVAEYNYPVETHTILTSDGYELTAYRIPYSPSLQNQNETRPLVIIMHGIFGSSDCWILNGPDDALPYLLANAGYDVWLANARGNTYSKKHSRIPTNSPKFWDFSWHEIGVKDLPAIIDYVLEKSNQTSLHFVGHSQGATAFFVMASEVPAYNQKVRTAHMLGPVVFVEHISNILVQLFGPLAGGSAVGSVMVPMEILPNMKALSAFLSKACSESLNLQSICVHELSPKAINYLVIECSWMRESHIDWIFQGPASLVILLNLIFLFRIMWVLITKLRSANTQETRQYRKASKALLVLIPLLGITYLLVLYGPEHGLERHVFEILRAFLISTQGFSVSFFYCFLNSEVRQALRHRFERWHDARNISSEQSMRNRRYRFSKDYSLRSRTESLRLTSTSPVPAANNE